MVKSKKDKYIASSKKRTGKPKRVLCQWTNEQMENAMRVVVNGEMGMNRAALQYGVPPTTLKDRMSGRVMHGSKIGPKPYLSYEEEKELVEFICTCSKMGYGKTRKEVLSIVRTAVSAKRKDQPVGQISDGWWVRFRKRWPELRMRKGDAFSPVREQMTSYDVYDSYFKLLGEVLEANKLKDKPAQIYNCDESGVPLDPKQLKIISAKGAKKVRQISSGNKTQITILGCVSATGQAIPPMVIFQGKNFNHSLSKGEIPGTLYGTSDSGWMDHELFANWFRSHFLVHAVSNRPLLLLLDGHSSHFTLDLVKSAAEEDVIILCLPPHTTSDTQPLDTSCFGPLKNYWAQLCHEYIFANPGRVITKYQFSAIFSQAWSKGMTINNITSGFQNTGIYPFNPQTILCKVSPKFQNIKDTTSHKAAAFTEKQHHSNKNITSARLTSSSDTNQLNIPPVLTEETTRLYENRLANGYDLYTDSNYVSWLKAHHPDTYENIPSACLTSSSNTNQLDTPPVLTEETIRLYENRLANGYDLYTDSNYVTWLKAYHPASLPSFTTVPSLFTELNSDLQEEELFNNCTGLLNNDANNDNGEHQLQCASNSLSSEHDVTLSVESSESPLLAETSPVTEVPTPSTTLQKTSPLSSLLVYPKPPHKKSHQTPKCARVLTSAESLAYLQEKERKKKEEQELKELRKKEREKKRLEREQDKVRKQQQKEAKKKQQENKITQANKKDAEVENDTSKVDSLRPAITRRTAKRRRLEETESNNSKKSKEDGLQHNEISQNECAACFGTYEEDLNNAGDLIAEWIQCTNKSCGVWSHCDCLDKTEGEHVCAICQTTFH